MPSALPTWSPSKAQSRAGRPSDLLYGFPSLAFGFNSAFHSNAPPALYSCAQNIRFAGEHILRPGNIVLKSDATLLTRIHSALESRTLPSYPSRAELDLPFLHKWEASVAAVRDDVRGGDASHHPLVNKLVHGEAARLVNSFITHGRFLSPDAPVRAWARSDTETDLSTTARAGVFTWTNNGADPGYARLLATVGNSSVTVAAGPGGVRTKPYVHSQEIYDVIAEILFHMHAYRLQYLLLTSYSTSVVFELAPGQLRMSPLISLGANASRIRSTGNLLTLMVGLALMDTVDQAWVDLNALGLGLIARSRKREREDDVDMADDNAGTAAQAGEPAHYLLANPPPPLPSLPAPPPPVNHPVTPVTPERPRLTITPSAPSSQRTIPRDRLPGTSFPMLQTSPTNANYPLFGPNSVRSPAFLRLASLTSDSGAPSAPTTSSSHPNLGPLNQSHSNARPHPYATPDRHTARPAASVPNLQRQRTRTRGAAHPPPNTPTTPNTPNTSNTTNVPNSSVSRLQYDSNNMFDMRSPAATPSRAHGHMRINSEPVFHGESGSGSAYPSWFGHRPALPTRAAPATRPPNRTPATRASSGSFRVMSMPRGMRGFPGGDPYVVERSASPTSGLSSGDDRLEALQLTSPDRAAAVLGQSNPSSVGQRPGRLESNEEFTPPTTPTRRGNQLPTPAQIKNSPGTHYSMRRVSAEPTPMLGDDNEWNSIPDIGSLTLGLTEHLRPTETSALLQHSTTSKLCNADLMPPVLPRHLHVTLESLRYQDKRWRVFNATITLPPIVSGFASASTLGPGASTRLPVIVKLFSRDFPPQILDHAGKPTGQIMDDNTAGWEEVNVVDEAEAAQNKPKRDDGRFVGFFKSRGNPRVCALIMQDVNPEQRSHVM